MAGFGMQINTNKAITLHTNHLSIGLDFLVVGTSNTKKALVKYDQSRWWSTMIEAITATGEALNLGIIFKGKELQAQWFIDEFKKTCPSWRFITSPNG